MLCKFCHYPLKQLTEPRCPECGLAFDPEDPNTFEGDLKRKPVWARIALLFIYTYIAAFFLHLYGIGAAPYAVRMALADAMGTALFLAPFVIVGYLAWYEGSKR